VVSDTTKLLSQLRLEVTAGVEAVDEVFHTAGGDEDMTDEEKKLLKKFNTKKEKEQKELAQLKAQQVAAKQAADNYSYKWTGGRGRGNHTGPYYSGAPEQQYYGEQGIRPQFAQQPLQYGYQAPAANAAVYADSTGKAGQYN